LYAASVYMSVHFNALRNNLGCYNEGSTDDGGTRAILAKWWHLLIPIVILVVLLLLQYSAYFAALLTTAAIIAVGMLRPQSRMDFAKTWNVLQDAGRKMAPIAAALACASMIVGTFELSGLPLRFTSVVLQATRGNLAITLALIAVAAMVLGMGLPTAACYVITMIFGVPALMDLGVARLTAHMFVFYFATLSAITPPVCLATYAAASVADSNMMQTGLYGVKLAIVAYLLPFAVVYSPVLLMQGQPSEIILACITGLFAAACLAMAVQGFMQKPTTLVERIMLVTASILLIQPGAATDALGLVLLGLAYLSQRMFHRSEHRLAV
ncbi:MAG: TRAP transporter large permease subunit, partial [Firmicutes bacterium]|nr:TRAP transporter large permease subunit [Bacillota bacterium]